ncbi:MAG: CHAT domain-containing protein [Acidobacteria bacterium]|nr:CHAT domain-containing protein [Acidobacteriota bacterium]
MSAQTRSQLVPLGKECDVTALTPPASKTIEIQLTAGQFFKAVVEQCALDVAVVLYSPEGTILAEVDSPNGGFGLEVVSWIAAQDGTYRLEAKALDATAQPGKICYQVLDLREKIPADVTRLEIQSKLQIAIKSWNQQTQESQAIAIQTSQSGLKLAELLNDPVDRAQCLTYLGDFYYATNRQKLVVEMYDRAVSDWEKAGLAAERARLHPLLAQLYYILRDSEKALVHSNHAVQLLSPNGNQESFAQVLNLLGNISADQGKNQDALAQYEQALAIYQKLGNRVAEGILLVNIGERFISSGDTQTGLKYLNQALPLLQKLEDHTFEANTRNSLGRVYLLQGKFQPALDELKLALTLATQTTNVGMQSIILTNIGNLYRLIGEPTKALTTLNQALELSQAAGDRRQSAGALLALARVHQTAQNWSLTRSVCAQALELIKQVGVKHLEAEVCQIIAIVDDSEGNIAAAQEQYQKALTIRQAIDDRIGTGNTLINLAGIQTKLGNPQKALEYQQQALEVFTQIEDSQGQVRAFMALAQTQARIGDTQTAITSLEQALSRIEALRSSIADIENRASFFTTVQGTFKLYIHLLMQRGIGHRNSEAIAKAFEANETSRARGLLDLLAAAQAKINVGVEPKLIVQEEAIRQKMVDQSAYLSRLLNQTKPDLQKIGIVRAEIHRLNNEYRGLEEKIREKHTRYAELTQPMPISVKVLQQQILDSETTLVEYCLGEEGSYAWVITQTEIQAFRLPKQGDIEAQARAFCQALSFQPGRTRELKLANITPIKTSLTKAGKELSEAILSPILPVLKTRRVLLVADGALHFVPFSALPLEDTAQSTQQKSGKASPLRMLERYEIVNLPSASILATLLSESHPQNPTHKQLAIWADPVFSALDPRLNQTKRENQPATSIRPRNQGSLVNQKDPLLLDESPIWNELKEIEIPRLPGTQTEVQFLKRLIPASNLFVASGFQANRQTLMETDLSQFQIVHLATHGYVNSEHPENSGLIFALRNEQGEKINGFLPLADVYQLKLNADLVVLSACETGLGKVLLGEGLVGMTRGFMYAGTRRVVVSLWSVSDRGTAELMKRFYRRMLTRRESPSVALRGAQLELLHYTKYKSPFYWAPFVIQGDYR